MTISEFDVETEKKSLIKKVKMFYNLTKYQHTSEVKHGNKISPERDILVAFPIYEKLIIIKMREIQKAAQSRNLTPHYFPFNNVIKYHKTFYDLAASHKLHLRSYQRFGNFSKLDQEFYGKNRHFFY